MKWSILVDVEVDNLNDFLNSYVNQGSITVRNKFVKGVMLCEEEEGQMDREKIEDAVEIIKTFLKEVEKPSDENILAYLPDEDCNNLLQLIDLAEKVLSVSGEMPDKIPFKEDGIYQCPSCGKEANIEWKCRNNAIEACTLAVASHQYSLDVLRDNLGLKAGESYKEVLEEIKKSYVRKDEIRDDFNYVYKYMLGKNYEPGCGTISFEKIEFIKSKLEKV